MDFWKWFFYLFNPDEILWGVFRKGMWTYFFDRLVWNLLFGDFSNENKALWIQYKHRERAGIYNKKMVTYGVKTTWKVLENITFNTS